MSVQRRRAETHDTDFARRTHHAAYRSVVERQFGPWNEAQQDAFFAAGWEAFPHEILFIEDTLVGYCAVENRADGIHVRESVIDPQYQGRGIGTALLRELQGMATRDATLIRLGTFHQNRAHELYARLGFSRVGMTPTHVLMEWCPPRSTPDMVAPGSGSVVPTA